MEPAAVEEGDAPALAVARAKLVTYWESCFGEGGQGSHDEWLVGWPQVADHIGPLLQDGSRVLVIGCGLSRIGEDVLAWTRDRGLLGVHVVAADISPSAIASLQQKRAGSGVEYVVADATQMPFGDGSFDIVLDKCLSDTLLFRTSKRHYVGALLVRLFFAEAYRVLAVDGGVLCVVTPKSKVPDLRPHSTQEMVAAPGQENGVSDDGKLQPRRQLKPFSAVTAKNQYPFARFSKVTLDVDALALADEAHPHRGYVHLAFR